MAVESFRNIAPRKKSTQLLIFVSFLFRSFLPSLGLNLLFFARNESLFVLFRFFFVFFPSLRPALSTLQNEKSFSFVRNLVNIYLPPV